MLARVACWNQFAIEEYKVCGGVQENNEVAGKFFESERVLDFAVCLRLLVERDSRIRFCGHVAQRVAPFREKSLDLGWLNLNPHPLTAEGAARPFMSSVGPRD